MTTLQFADTHNLVAFLTKSAESEGFKQIVDFLNASLIRYALTVNPTIYTLCIEQFWSTAKAKTVNGEVYVPSDNIAEEEINEENVPTHSNDPLLSGEDRLKLKELMTLCTNLQNKVLDLEHTKTTQALEIDSLKRRVKKLKKKQRSRTHRLRRLYKVGLSARVVSFEDEENVHDEDMFGVNDLEGDEIVVETEVADKDVNLSVDEVTLAQALTALKSAKVKDKGKGKMVEEEHVMKMSKKEQLKLDEELALKLQAKEDEKEMLAKEKAQKVKEPNIAWDDIQAKVEADY
ncbi:hypothetical protein Tco_0450772 [Tanacetum coccineum]